MTDADLERAIQASLGLDYNNGGDTETDRELKQWRENEDTVTQLSEPPKIVSQRPPEPSKDPPQPGMVLKTTIENAWIKRCWIKPGWSVTRGGI